MVKKIAIVILLVAGIAKGCSFVLSDDFQRYGDEGNRQWTCRVNKVLGEFYITMSKYDRAKYFFERILTRCPKTKMEEEAFFKVGYCYEGMGQNPTALVQYRKFLKRYPRSDLYPLALKKTQVLAD